MHCSAGGQFAPQQLHRGAAVVRGEQGGGGEDPVALALDQLRNHLAVQRGVVLDAATNSSERAVLLGQHMHKRTEKDIFQRTTISRRRGWMLLWSNSRMALLPTP